MQYICTRYDDSYSKTFRRSWHNNHAALLGLIGLDKSPCACSATETNDDDEWWSDVLPHLGLQPAETNKAAFSTHGASTQHTSPVSLPFSYLHVGQEAALIPENVLQVHRQRHQVLRGHLRL